MWTQLQRHKQRVEERSLRRPRQKRVWLWAQGSGRPDEDILGKAGSECWYQVRAGYNQRDAQKYCCEHHFTRALTPHTIEALRPGQTNIQAAC